MSGFTYHKTAAGCLDLRQTLDCGQAFRWQECGDGKAWQGVVEGRKLQIREFPEELWFSCSEEEFRQFWEDYFDLKTDYAEKKARLSKLHPALREAIANAPGLRLLRQKPFETICSFILSQNCNIQRIKGMIQRLCACCGEKIEEGFYAFPTPEVLAVQTKESLSAVRAGFRTAYLIGAAQTVAEGRIDLEEIGRQDLLYGREALQRIRGIGPKVAECVLLYGFHKPEAFPMDVWMKRAMQSLFPGQTPALFGADAGLAQQYIFHYARTAWAPPKPAGLRPDPQTF